MQSLIWSTGKVIFFSGFLYKSIQYNDVSIQWLYDAMIARSTNIRYFKNSNV